MIAHPFFESVVNNFVELPESIIANISVRKVKIRPSYIGMKTIMPPERDEKLIVRRTAGYDR